MKIEEEEAEIAVLKRRSSSEEVSESGLAKRKSKA